MPDSAVILSALEQEYLLRIIEDGLEVRDRRRLFLWTQGQFQALLPHQALVCLRLASDGAPRALQTELLHGGLMGAALRRQLADPEQGLALRLARHAAAAPGWSGIVAANDAVGGPLQAALCAAGMDNVLIAGSEALAGGGSFFALFGMPHKPGPQQAYFLRLLLPYLHMATLALAAAPAAGADRQPALSRPVSAREGEVLHWLREGKNNDEIGQLLGISALTVKNHLQRLYRLLGVSNRAHAVTRCAALRLLAA